MWFKNKEAPPPVYKDCPEGSEHAWRYGTRLFDNEAERDQARADYQLQWATSKLYDYLMGWRLKDTARLHPSDVKEAAYIIATNIMSSPDDIIMKLKELQSLKEDADEERT